MTLQGGCVGFCVLLAYVLHDMTVTCVMNVSRCQGCVFLHVPDYCSGLGGMAIMAMMAVR